MRYSKAATGVVAKCDMTPMIDMTFLLIAFFMVLIKFTEVDQNERIRLPSSQLARPPKEGEREAILTLQLTKEETVIFVGEELPIDDVTGMDVLSLRLLRERQIIDATEDRSAANTKVIIRADRDTKIGKVQEVIGACQKTGFEKFTLRAKQQGRT